MTRTRDVILAVLAALSLAGAVAAGGADIGAGAAHRGLPLGVDPASAARFQGETFVCDGGAVSLDFSRVNDDYCDCADGADEPGTSACSNGSFHCRNRGHQPVTVPSSRVGDGVCDCCDGSDERAAGGAACANTCAAAGASRRDALKREVNDYRAGLRKKRALLDAAPAERKRWTERRDALVRDTAAARAEADAARAAADAASAERERAEEASKAFEVEVAASEDSLAADATAAMDDYHASENTEEARAADDDGADLADLADIADPADPADIADPVADETDEARGERVARQWIKSDRASFSESPDDVSSDDSTGSSARHAKAHLVDVDDVDVDGDDDAASPAGPTSPEPDAETAAETKKSVFSFRSWFRKAGKNDTPEAREARARLARAAAASSAAAAKATAAEKRRDEKQTALDAVAADLAHFVGERAEFQHMLGQCYEARVDKYEYSVCPFAESTQDRTRLGRMVPLEPETRGDGDGENAAGVVARRLSFKDGERCWNGPARSMTVSLTCGAAPRLFAVTEPSRCEYAAVLATPAVCDETVAAALEAELAAMEREIAALARGEELR